MDLIKIFRLKNEIQQTTWLINQLDQQRQDTNENHETIKITLNELITKRYHLLMNYFYLIK